MSKRCPDCYGRTSTPGRCPNCRAEHNAQAVDHDHDAEATCAVCGDAAPEGDYAGDRAGIWMCGPCQTLGLLPRQRDQLVAETPTALGGLIEWAVGADDAYPEQDPGIETGFEPASTRVAADGGQQLCGYCEEPLDREADDPPLTFEGEDVHWDCLDEAMEAADDAEWDTDAEVAADGGEA